MEESRRCEIALASLTSHCVKCSLSSAPAGFWSDLQQALLSLNANVTQQMQICSRSFSTLNPVPGHQHWNNEERYGQTGNHHQRHPPRPLVCQTPGAPAHVGTRSHA